LRRRAGRCHARVNRLSLPGSDFTLAEIKTLRAVQPLEDRLLDALKRAGWNSRGAPVFIQTFETANLRYLRGRPGR
jgi:glycerophosphoryl diester phosphodiesterase